MNRPYYSREEELRDSVVNPDGYVPVVRENPDIKWSPIDLSKYGPGLKRAAPLKVRRQNRQNAVTRWMTAGLAISPHTDDLRDLIKREVWTRGKTIQGLALALGMNLSYVSRVLSCHGNPAGTKCQRITPVFLDAVIRVMAIPSAVARRMHTLGARDAGWKL